MKNRKLREKIGKTIEHAHKHKHSITKINVIDCSTSALYLSV